MLPDLARLHLHCEAEAEAVAVASNGASDEPDLTASEPPLFFSPSPRIRRRPLPSPLPLPPPLPLPLLLPLTPPPAEEVDDPDNDVQYKELMGTTDEEKRRYDKRTTKINITAPFDTLRSLRVDRLNQYLALVTIDQPPNRHIFSALGTPGVVCNMRLNKESVIASGTNGIQMNAFEALRALRVRFANTPPTPRSADPPQGCGTTNCHETKVRLSGTENWRVALRAIMVALDQDANRWHDGTALPKTVTIRAPKRSVLLTTDDAFEDTIQNRDELQLTLLAAVQGIAPQIYAAFPIKVLSPEDVLCGRSYGYVFEDGWLDLDQLISGLQSAYLNKLKVALELHLRNIGNAIVALLRDVAKADFVVLDIKLRNMVGRLKTGRVNNQYEVKLIDFDPVYTTQANMHYPAMQHTSPECIFFVNGLLLLNTILGHANDKIPMFAPLATEVVKTWREMKLDNHSFCFALKQDAQCVAPGGLLFSYNLNGEPAEGFHKMLKRTFYQMLKAYGKTEVVEEAETLPGSAAGFIDRFVEIVETRFKSAVGANI